MYKQETKIFCKEPPNKSIHAKEETKPQPDTL